MVNITTAIQKERIQPYIRAAKRMFAATGVDSMDKIVESFTQQVETALALPSLMRTCTNASALDADAVYGLSKFLQIQHARALVAGPRVRALDRRVRQPHAVLRLVRQQPQAPVHSFARAARRRSRLGRRAPRRAGEPRCPCGRLLGASPGGCGGG